MLLHTGERHHVREVNPKVYGREDWSEMVRNGYGFAREIISKPKMFIIGVNEGLENVGQY